MESAYTHNPKLKIKQDTANKIELICFLLVRFSSVFLPTLILAAAAIGGIYTFIGVFVMYGLYGLVTLVLHTTGIGEDNNPSNEFKFTNYRFFGLSNNSILFIYIAQQLIAFPVILYWVSLAKFNTLELVGLIISWGINGGSVGIFVGHELIHRKSNTERWAGDFLWSLIWYSHFRISHAKGHHVTAGLPTDSATARQGETVWRFFPRTIIKGYLQCWRIEKRQLESRGRPWYSYKNYMWMDTFYKISVPLTIFFIFGAPGLGFFLAATILAVLIGETANYFSHYGIERKIINGKPEPIKPEHSWDAPNKLADWFLFSAGKHADHHCRPTAPFNDLKLEYPQHAITYGFPVTILVCWIPPLFFKMMEPRFPKVMDNSKTPTDTLVEPERKTA